MQDNDREHWQCPNCGRKGYREVGGIKMCPGDCGVQVKRREDIIGGGGDGQARRS